MNLTLLIADDEEIERRALQMQLSRAFPSVKLLKAAANGLELMDAIRKYNPDIVIADIEMPGVNGLSALAQIRKEGFNPYVIIMTAYSSEHYMRESLSLRVYAYLEKPIRRERMIDTLQSLMHEAETEQKRRAELLHMQDTVRSMHKMIKSELMAVIESDEASTDQIAELLRLLEISSRRFLIMTFSISEGAGDADSAYEKRIEELNIFAKIRDVVRSRGWIDGHVTNRRVSCLVPVEINADKDNDYRIRQAACYEADEVLNELGMRAGVRVGIGVSTIDPARLILSRQQSIQALFRQDQHSMICHYEDQPIPAGVENLFISEETALLEFILSGNEEQTENCIHSCFSALPEWITFDVLRIQAFEMLLALNRGSQIHLFEGFLKRISEEIFACADKASLEKYITQVCMECIRRNRENEQHWQNDIIARAKQYIDACYSMDISLEGTAEAIGVSKFYLSRLFKTKLGMNYSAYLADRRVCKAALLMKARIDLTNREIAERVGFHDPDYFGKVFKKIMGCTVSEYRTNNK